MSTENEEPIWLPVDLLTAIHERQLREFGGPSGVHDRSALESALGWARNKWAYEGAELPELAAAYAFGIARNHFVDGNNRVALLALVTFLGLNSVVFAADEAEAASIILALAAGEVEEEGLARWIRDCWPKE